MNTYDEMIRFYERVQQEITDFENAVSAQSPFLRDAFDDQPIDLTGAFMWGFGTSFDKASPFSSEDARNEYMAHVRTCAGHHDPRGQKFSRCRDMNPDWFATDVAQGPE